MRKPVFYMVGRHIVFGVPADDGGRHVVLPDGPAFRASMPEYPVSGDAIARYLDDPHPSHEGRRYPLGDLLWSKVTAKPEHAEWEGRSAVLARCAS